MFLKKKLNLAEFYKKRVHPSARLIASVICGRNVLSTLTNLKLKHP